MEAKYSQILSVDDDKNLSLYSSKEADRISDLPEPILHQILSLVALKQAVQTSILSTRWRYVWKSLPILDFNCGPFSLIDPNQLIEFIDKVLNLRDSSSNIQRFRIVSFTSYNITSYLNSWILIALSCNVQELSLTVSIDDQEFRFLDSLFTHESLTLFEFNTCFHSPKISDQLYSLSLPRLKTLLLQNVWFESCDIINKILSSCPVLESFTISGSFFCQSEFGITAPKLKHLVIIDCFSTQDCYSIKLHAPNLISFRWIGHVSSECSIENLPALVKAEILVRMVKPYVVGFTFDISEMKEMYGPKMIKLLRVLQNVKILKLSNRFLEVISGVPAVLKSSPIQFCNLRSLKLTTSNSRHCARAMTYLLDSSPNVESLYLEIDMVTDESANVGDYWKEGMPLQCMLYHLQFVKITCVGGCLDEFMFVKILLKNAMVLKKLILSLAKFRGGRWESEFINKVLNYPRASASVEILFPKPEEAESSHYEWM